MKPLENVEIEVTKRFDGRFTVWAWLPDPTYTPPEKPIYPHPKRWVVVGSIGTPNEINAYAGRGSRVKFLNK